MNDRLKRAVKILEEKQTSCVILSSDGCEKTSDAMGIKPLMMELRVNQSAFQGCVIADKVIGKAAALMTVLGKADAVYGKIMSENAREFLEKAGMSTGFVFPTRAFLLFVTVMLLLEVLMTILLIHSWKKQSVIEIMRN